MRLYLFATLLFLAIGACQSPTKSQKASSETKQDYDCKHCGMPSQEFPQWYAKIVLEKEVFWFCSPRCMLARYQEMKPATAKELWVKDYYTNKFIDARKAFYVTGSKVLGPMGHDFVPLQDEKAAKDFMKEHHGEELITFPAIDASMIQRVAK